MLSQNGCYSGLLEAQPVEVDSIHSQGFIFNMFKALDEESQTQVSFSLILTKSRDRLRSG